MSRIWFAGLSLAAALGAMAAIAAPASASPRIVNWSPIPMARYQPAIFNTTPAMVGGYIAMVVNVSKVPCFNCVNGSESGTFGEGDPLGYVTLSNTSLGLMYIYYNVSYNGSCTVTVSLTQGTKTLVTASGTFNPTPAVDVSELHVTRSASWHGAATMHGHLVCGSIVVNNNGTVWFQ